MAQNMPWSLKGIDPQVRDAAREAARRSGMSVGEWLESVIRDQAPTQGDDDDTISDLQTRLERLARPAVRPAPARAAQDMRGAAEIDALVNHAARLDARTRETEAKTTTALESILGWIERTESRMAATERDAALRQERATSIIADAIKTVSSRVADVERRASAPQAPRSADARAADARPAPQQRPAFSRDTLASAVSDIRSRRQALETGAAAPAWPHPERRSGERRAEFTPVMNSIRGDIARLREDISGIARQPVASSLEDSIRDLARRLESREAGGGAEAIMRPLARIEAEMGRLHASQGDERFSRIERGIAELGERLEALAGASGEPRLMAAAVSELAALKQDFAKGGAGRLDALSSQIAALADDMHRVRDDLARNAGRGDFESALQDMRDALTRDSREASGIGHGLMQRISHQLDTVAAAVGGMSTGAMSQEDKTEIAALSRKLDQLAQRTQPESDVLARRIEALAIKLEDLSRIGSTELLERVDRLSEQLEVLTTRGPVAIEKQIDTLAARIETLAKSRKLEAVTSATAVVDLAPLESMIGDLARRMDDASRPDASAQSLQALERQISALSSRLDQQPHRAPASDGLENTLQDLMRYLGGLREETTNAVDRAARAAVADAISKSVPAAAPQAGPDLALLREDLAGLRDVHSSIDQRTHHAINAVNDTLEKIVSRLAQLEDDISRERPAGFMQAPLTAEAAPAFAREPRAARGLPPATEDAAGSPGLAPATPRPEPRPGEPVRQDSARHDSTRQEPRVSVPVPVPAADAAPVLAQGNAADVPLEPGSGRPRARAAAPEGAAMAAPAAASLNPNLIAAARRAAQAASAEAETLKGEAGGKGGKFKAPRVGLPISLKETLEKRRKPILLGLAAIVLAIGAGQVATTMLGDGEPQNRPSAARIEAPQRQGADPGPPMQLQGSATQPTAPVAAPALPPKDQRSLAAPDQVPADPRAETTASVRPAPERPAQQAQPAAVAATAQPAPAAQEPPREPAQPMGLAPVRVTSLGDIPANLGTAGMRRAALEGDANAVYELATRAADGPTRDHRTALRMFERAAAAGLTPAQFRLGNIYEKGIGVTRDARLAATWYKRAADRGNAKAMHNLAVLIAEGVEGRPDYAAAAELFRKAAEFGVRDSQYNLAILLGRGLGLEQDLQQSYAWFAIAARGGDNDAAKKRDEVGARLTGADLAAANALTNSWRPKTPDPIANDISAPPEGWDPQPRQNQPRAQQPRPRGA
jgi:localization factor PodJL